MVICAGVGVFLAAEDLHEGAFAGAVGADQAGALAFEEGDGDAGEERPGAVGLGEVFAG